MRRRPVHAVLNTAPLEDHAMSHGRAAQFCGVDYRATRRWVSGAQDIPAAVVMLLAVMQKHGVSLNEARGLAKLAELPDPRPRGRPRKNPEE